MVFTSCAICSVIRNTKPNCVAHFIASVSVLTERGEQLLIKTFVFLFTQPEILTIYFRCHFVHSSQEALTHNRQVAAYHARLQQQQQNRMKTMSMSTGSDRETSSVGSISPTMTHVQNQGGNGGFFVDQQSPTGVFTYTFSPSNSPIHDMAPISPPPPTQFVKPQPFVDHHQQQHQQQHKHASLMKQMSIPEERLPVFNQISSAIDSMNTLTI